MPRSSFRVTDPKAPRRAVDPWTRAKARAIMADAQSETPVQTGTLRKGWRVVRAGELARWRVSNATPYARFVEFGTRHMAPRAMLGKAVARGRVMR